MTLCTLSRYMDNIEPPASSSPEKDLTDAQDAAILKAMGAKRNGR